ncbi:MAG: hypothetical protein MSF41_00665 [Oscillibacter sp.]|nr:hypothetical protein [Oscillibacter sp.]
MARSLLSPQQAAVVSRDDYTAALSILQEQILGISKFFCERRKRGAFSKDSANRITPTCINLIFPLAFCRRRAILTSLSRGVPRPAILNFPKGVAT